MLRRSSSQAADSVLVMSEGGRFGNNPPSAFYSLPLPTDVMKRNSSRKHVAWDIETTGFGWDDKITVTGFWYPTGTAELILNSSGDEISGSAYEQELADLSGVPVSVTVTEDERGLLKSLHQTVFESFDREYNQLIAYNADSWSGGFDLPFLRTRCVKNGLDWVFSGVQFADMFEPVKKRMNTQHTAFGVGSDVNSLTGAHEVLLDQTEGVPIQTTDDGVEHVWYREQSYDPFDDSGSAVSHYESGDYLPILQHNLADVHRTWELGELVREYAPSRDVSDKKL